MVHRTRGKNVAGIWSTKANIVESAYAFSDPGESLPPRTAAVGDWEMKIYDDLFNEQQIRTLYFNNKTIKEISKIVNIPKETLRKRMKKTVQIRKTTYFACPICEKKVAASMHQQHIKSHLWAIRDNIYCYHCRSQYVVKSGFSQGNQVILCRQCGRTSSLGVSHSRKQKATNGLCNIAKILRKTGYTYRGIKEFMKRNYKLSIDEKTAWRWVNIEIIKA